MKTIRKQIGDFIKRHRINAYMSLEDCSTILEIDLKTIEAGRKKLPEQKFLEIQKLYDISHDEIVKFRTAVVLEIIKKFNVNQSV